TRPPIRKSSCASRTAVCGDSERFLLEFDQERRAIARGSQVARPFPPARNPVRWPCLATSATVCGSSHVILLERLGPGRPVFAVRTLESFVADASADTRFVLFVLGVFAIL